MFTTYELVQDFATIHRIPMCTSKSTLSFKGPEGASGSAFALGFTACRGSQFQC